MKRLAKILAAFVAALIVLPVFAFLAYDALVFWPHRDDIQEILVNADPLDRSPPPKIRAYLQAQHQDASPSVMVARQLHSRFLPHKGMLRWHMQGVLWEQLVSLHLSQDETLGLYSTLVYNGRGYGLSALSNRMFAKPLSALSDQEAATVVAYTWGPSLYAHYPDRLQARRDLLLSRVRERR
jgi:hypothetical protein